MRSCARNRELMDVSLIITFALALVIGVSIGLLGGGGAILAVPVLTYITGLEPVQAIPSSLLIVRGTSAILMFSFAAVMIAAAVAMIRGRKGNGDEEESAKLPVVKIVITGAVVGLVSGFVGAGGGFLIVPALALLARLPMRLAVATSLMIVTMQSGAGLIGYAVSTPLDWVLALSIAAAAVIGS